MLQNLSCRTWFQMALVGFQLLSGLLGFSFHVECVLAEDLGMCGSTVRTLALGAEVGCVRF